MTSIGVDNSPVLLAVIQALLAAQGLDEVHSATAHGARVISSYSTISLYETRADGSMGLAFRSGERLGPSSLVLEDLLRDNARSTQASVSTLDLPQTDREQVIVRDYASRSRLTIARPLQAYGELVGVIVLHYSDRPALAAGEFDALRRFTAFAALAIGIARTRVELNGIAYSDVLTGLANRRWLEVEFDRLQGSAVSILLIDFDGLKLVNDELGFDRGDALIRAVGASLAAAATDAEFVVRYGGDEFVLVMSGAGRSAALARAEELTAILDAISLPDDLTPLFRGASVGAATADVGENLWDLLQRASAEMRSRKRRRKTDRDLRESAGGGEGPASVHREW